MPLSAFETCYCFWNFPSFLCTISEAPLESASSLAMASASALVATLRVGRVLPFFITIQLPFARSYLTVYLFWSASGGVVLFAIAARVAALFAAAEVLLAELLDTGRFY